MVVDVWQMPFSWFEILNLGLLIRFPHHVRHDPKLRLGSSITAQSEEVAPFRCGGNDCDMLPRSQQDIDDLLVWLLVLNKHLLRHGNCLIASVQEEA